jgi:hypothetical protein
MVKRIDHLFSAVGRDIRSQFDFFLVMLMLVFMTRVAASAHQPVHGLDHVDWDA